MEPQRAVISWLSPGEVRHEFNDSLVGMFFHDRESGLNQIHASMSLISSPRVAEARSQLCDAFLKDFTMAQAQWLLMLDTDMSFEGDLLDRLTRSAVEHKAQVMGGLCFTGNDDRMYPTIYRLTEDEGFTGAEPVENYPKNGVVKVGATGGACLLIHRNLLHRMTRPWPEGFGTSPSGKPNPYPWFVEGGVNHMGVPFGEDVAFCMRVNALGLNVMVNTGIKLGHVKTRELNEDSYRAWKYKQRNRRG